MRTIITGTTIGLCCAVAILSSFFGHRSRALAVADSDIYKKAQQAQTHFLETLKPLVSIDSGTGDRDGLNSVKQLLLPQFKAVGATVELKKFSKDPDYPDIKVNPDDGEIIVATVKGSGKGKILLLAHSDTVFKKGTVANRPFTIKDGKVFGAGVMDDKGGIVLGIEALKILQELNFKDFETITFLINPDEETGSFGSRRLIKETARKHDVALVLEFGTAEDTVSKWRKGIGNYSFNITGKSAHAGADSKLACNALLEATHLIQEFNKLETIYQAQAVSKLKDPEEATTVNFTRLETSESSQTYNEKQQIKNSRNTIPGYAEAQADVRVLDAKEYDRVKRGFDRVKQNQLLPCSQIEVQAIPRRPPFPANSKTNALILKAQDIYQTIPVEGFRRLGTKGSGGGTDGNYANYVGTSTLDALGPVGGGAHTKDEYIKLDRVPARIYLLTKLMMAVGASTKDVRSGSQLSQ